MGKQMTLDEFKNKVYLKYADSVKITSDYNGSINPVDFIYYCDTHGEIKSTMNAKNLLSKTFQPCKECFSDSRKGKREIKTGEEYYNEFKQYIELNGGKLITPTWEKSKGKYEIDCGNADHPNFITTHDKIMHSNQWCPYCCGRKGYFNSYYKNLIESKNGEMLSEYKGSYDHIKVKCKTHNYIWDIMPLNLKKGRWCPICNLPKSEIAIFDLLTNNGYNFQIQYQFEDLTSEIGNSLKFDFAIFNNNKELMVLVESDGSSHRENRSVESFHYNTFLSDALKEEYCIKNNIKLIRIYHDKTWDYDYHYNYAENELISKINNILGR